MSLLYPEKTVVGIKPEVTYGTYTAPDCTSAANALQVFNLSHNPHAQEVKHPENYPASNLNVETPYGTTRLCPINFSTYLWMDDEEFSQAAGDPDKAILTLINMWAQDTIVLSSAANTWSWTFGDAMNGDSLSVAIYEDGHLTKYNGVRGTGVLKCTPGDRYVIDWTLLGRLEGHDTAALPSASYWGDTYLYAKSEVAHSVTNETVESWEFNPGATAQHTLSPAHADGMGEVYLDKFRPTLKVRTVLGASTTLGSFDPGDAWSIKINANNSVKPHFGFIEGGADYVIAGKIITRSLVKENGIWKADTEILMSDVTGIVFNPTSVAA